MKSKNRGFGLYDHYLHNQAPLTEQKEISKYDLNLVGAGHKLKEGIKTGVSKVVEKSPFGGFRADNGGQVYVKEYKRRDGTQVKAHWRDWPGNFDPNKRLTDMSEPELGHAIDFWLDEDKYIH